MNIILKQKLPALKQKAKTAAELLGLAGQKAQVVGTADISISMRELFKRRDDTGSMVQRTIQRLFALALAFDDDGEIPFYLFGVKAQKLGVVKEGDCHNCIDGRRITLEYGTKYAQPLLMVAQDHFPEGSYQPTTKGWFGRKKRGPVQIQQLANPVKEPVFNIFVTDGENQDEREAEDIIHAISVLPMFTQFVGIGNSGFKFLKKLDSMTGRFIDNAGFCQIEDIDGMSDEDLYAQLLNEFPDYIKAAREAGLVG